MYTLLDHNVVILCSLSDHKVVHVAYQLHAQKLSTIYVISITYQSPTLVMNFLYNVAYKFRLCRSDTHNRNLPTDSEFISNLENLSL